MTKTKTQYKDPFPRDKLASMGDEEEELEVELSDGEDEQKGANSRVRRAHCMLE